MFLILWLVRSHIFDVIGVRRFPRVSTSLFPCLLGLEHDQEPICRPLRPGFGNRHSQLEFSHRTKHHQAALQKVLGTDNLRHQIEDTHLARASGHHRGWLVWHLSQPQVGGMLPTYLPSSFRTTLKWSAESIGVFFAGGEYGRGYGNHKFYWNPTSVRKHDLYCT